MHHKNVHDYILWMRVYLKIFYYQNRTKRKNNFYHSKTYLKCLDIIENNRYIAYSTVACVCKNEHMNLNMCRYHELSRTIESLCRSGKTIHINLTTEQRIEHNNSQPRYLIDPYSFFCVCD